MRAGSRSRMTEKQREKQEHLACAAGSERSPVEKPPFTLGQIKKVIPPHCFERSVLKSFSYVVQDLVIAAALLYLALVTIPAAPSPLHYAAWPLYWIAQGCVCTGLWVIGHECGHNAFSDYPLLDDIVGLVLHSSLMVPYFSWKYSHRRHHSNIGSLERDEVFVPKKKEALPWYTPYVCNNPAGRLLQIVVQLTLGWPLYLATNASGRLYPRFACHYDPYGPIYSDRERAQVFVSDAGVVAVSFGLYRLAATFGFWWVARVYAVPLLIVNAWLVLVTFLQHTHPAGCAARWPPWTATTASSTVCSTTSPTHTSCTISSPPCRTTTPWRPPRRSSPSSASTTSSTPLPSPRRPGAKPGSASTSSPRTAGASSGTSSSRPLDAELRTEVIAHTFTGGLGEEIRKRRR